MGVRGIKLSGDDEVKGMDVIQKGSNLYFLTIMEKGLGKKTPVSQFHNQSRGGQGVKVANVTAKTGKVAFAQVAPQNCKEMIVTSKKGQVVKLELSSVPKLSRATQGVILMRFSNPNDSISSATCIVDE